MTLINPMAMVTWLRTSPNFRAWSVDDKEIDASLLDLKLELANFFSNSTYLNQVAGACQVR